MFKAPTNYKSVAQRLVLASSAFLLGGVLTACGGTTNGGSSSSKSSEPVASSASSIPVSSSSSRSSSSAVSISSVVSSSSSSVSSSRASSSSVSSSAGTQANVVFENFEDDAVGAAPANWQTFIAWTWNNSGSSNNYAKVETGRAVSGTKAIHFKGGENPAQITYELPANVTSGKKLYIAAMVYMTRAIGNDASDNHEHILGLKKTKDANDEIRFGQIKGHLGTNHIPSDDISPRSDQWHSGPTISANAWHCIELDLRGDLAYNTLIARVDGVEIHKIDAANDWNNGLSNAQWMADKFKYAMFGFHSFSGKSNDVWMDDIQLSTEPVTCKK